MPILSDEHPHLQLLDILGDPVVLTLLTQWLLPSGHVGRLRRLIINDTQYKIYRHADPRFELVHGAAASLEQLNLNLNPRELFIP